ncbi:hypothetical protein Pelo_141 [Pelomyxa schiedti]|nr:hypothetical protein Pelo_141 [Pelomyxa schiedti]
MDVPNPGGDVHQEKKIDGDGGEVDDEENEDLLDGFLDTGGFNFVSRLNRDALVRIFMFLNLKDLCSVSLVNRQFNMMSNDEEVWRSMCSGRFCLPQSPPPLCKGKPSSWKQFFKTSYAKQEFICGAAPYSFRSYAESTSILAWDSSNILVCKHDGVHECIDALCVRLGTEHTVRQETITDMARLSFIPLPPIHLPPPIPALLPPFPQVVTTVLPISSRIVKEIRQANEHLKARLYTSVNDVDLPAHVCGHLLPPSNVVSLDLSGLYSMPQISIIPHRIVFTDLSKHIFIFASEMQALVEVYDIRSGVHVTTMRTSDHRDRVSSILYDSYSREVVAGYTNGKIRLWQLHTNTTGTHSNNSDFSWWQAHKKSVCALASVKPSDFPFLTTIISVSNDGNVKVWKRGSGHYHCEMEYDVGHPVYKLEIDKDSRRFVIIGAESAWVASLESNTPLTVITPKFPIQEAFVSHGCLALCGYSISVYDTRSCKELCTLPESLMNFSSSLLDTPFLFIARQQKIFVYNIFNRELVHIFVYQPGTPSFMCMAGSDCLAVLCGRDLVLLETFTSEQGKKRKRSLNS